MTQNPLIFKSGVDDRDSRIDVFLHRLLPEYSREEIKVWIKNAKVHVNGSPIQKASYRMGDDDAVEIHIQAFSDKKTIASKISRPSESFLDSPKVQRISDKPYDLDILFEDDHILVLFKPAGLIVYPPQGNVSEEDLTSKELSLVSLLLAKSTKWSRMSPELSGGVFRPAIVHRLDRDTSGVMVVCKTDQAHDVLAEYFRKKWNHRVYVALCYGQLPRSEVFIESYLKRDVENRKRFMSIPKENFDNKEIMDESELKTYRYAGTIFRSLHKFGPRISLIRAELKTGRTHQIRLHAETLGIPVLGDPLYGKPEELPHKYYPKPIRDMIKGVKRQMLHAQSLGFKHPVSGELMRFEAAPPADFQELLLKLDEEFKNGV